jgi:hypothetical protein
MDVKVTKNVVVDTVKKRLPSDRAFMSLDTSTQCGMYS